MKSFFNFRNYLTIIVTTLCISLGMEIKYRFTNNTTIFFILSIIISLLISSVIADLLANVLFGIKFFRRLIIGRKSIEGFWKLEPLKENNDDIFSLYALAEIYFEKSDFSLRTTVYRLDNHGQIFQSSSENITYLENNFQYINFFSYVEGNGFSNALAFGKFFSSPGENNVDAYEGIIVTFDGDKPIRQRGVRVRFNEIKKMKKAEGKNWHQTYLKNLSIEEHTGTNLSINSNLTGTKSNNKD